MVGTRIVTRFVDFIARMLYYLTSHRISFDTAFHHTYINLHSSELRKYLTPLYTLARHAVLDFIKAMNICLYLRQGSKFKLHSEIPKGISFRDVSRIALCYHAPRLLRDEKLVIAVERYCRRYGLSSDRIENILNEISPLLGPAEKLAFQYSFPIWFVTTLLNFVDPTELEHLLKALNDEYLWLRINTLLIDYDKALRLLELEGVVYEIDRDVWFLVRVLESPKPVHELDSFKSGFVVTQDKASVLAVLAMDIEPGMRILDACAAPGMKSSLIMQLTENNCELFFLDISLKRIRSSIPLLKRLGVDLGRVHIVHCDSTNMYVRNVDQALIDAPCTNSGAIPRDPAIKLQLMDSRWASGFNEIQFMLLRSVMKLNPEVVVYCVCSLLPWEGEGVVIRILEAEKTNFTIQSPRIPGQHGYRLYRFYEHVRRLFPHIHRTQGFFISRFQRV